MRILIRNDGEVIVDEDGEERPADRSDPFDVLRWFRARVEMEEGITAFRMMRALSPWSGALSAAGWLDFDAWLAAFSAPMLEEAVPGDDKSRLSGIELHPVAHVCRSEHGGARAASVSVEWRPLGRYAEPVRRPGGRVEELCSVSFCDPRLIGHLPLSVHTTLKVQDIRTRRPWGEQPVLAEALPGVYDMLVEHPTFYDTIVLGFMDDISFHGSPGDTAEVADGLRQAVDEIRSGAASETTRGREGGLRGLLADPGS